MNQLKLLCSNIKVFEESDTDVAALLTEVVLLIEILWADDGQLMVLFLRPVETCYVKG